jgi:hypothetical protein
MTDLDLDALERLAKAAQGRCRRCGFLRQQHQPDMAHRIEDAVVVGPDDVLALAALARRAGYLESALFLTQEALIAAHLPTPDMRHVRCTLCDLLPSPAEMYAIDAATAQPEVRGS